MMILRNKMNNIPTYIRYFLSYLLIMSALILGFFLIIRHQLLQNYTDHSLENAQKQMNNIASSLEDDIIYLSQIDSTLTTNNDIIKFHYQLEDSYYRKAHETLKTHAKFSQFISGIAFLGKRSNQVIYTNSPAVTYADGVFCIQNSTLEIVRFDPSPYLGADSGQLIMLPCNTVPYLIYFPSISPNANYIFFYFLDTTEIQKFLNNFVSDEIAAIALISPDGQIVTGVNSDLMTPYLEYCTGDASIRHINSSVSLCTQTGIRDGFIVASIISNDILSTHIEQASIYAYISLLLLSILGFVLILFAMHYTYTPLHRLTHRLVPDFDRKGSHLKQLENAFTQTDKENQLLTDKLENYRLSIQKSLLDAMLTSQTSLPFTLDKHTIDYLFDSNTAKNIYVIHLKTTVSDTVGSCLLPYNVTKYLKAQFSAEGLCLVLKQDSDSITLLINFIWARSQADVSLRDIMQRFYEEYHVMSAISNSSASPLDIPSLYENAICASTLWPKTPVADYESMPSRYASQLYPHDELDQLQTALSSHDFQAAKNLVSDFLLLCTQSFPEKNELSNFFVRCILVDVLTNIINCLSQNYVNFSIYNELYCTTLYFCRSCPYEQKAEEITGNIYKLLDICEQEISTKFKNIPFKKIIDECYCDPDFSITILADKLKVSPTYMSYWFRHELNTSFSDYLWMLRLNKSKELLKTTDLSIDEISTRVGYLNPSSFRRKIKQETGLTPSQLRAEVRNQTYQ